VSLDALRVDLTSLSQAAGDRVEIRSAADVPLTNPIQVSPTASGWCVEYNPSYQEPSLSLGLAHEYGHLLLVYRGLVSPKSRFFEGIDEFLLATVGNAISHLDLVRLLRNEYALGSEEHFRVLRQGLAGLLECALDPRDLSRIELVGTGVSLFDTVRGIPELGPEMAPALEANDAVALGYSAAESHLARVSYLQGAAEQEAGLTSFLEAVGAR